MSTTRILTGWSRIPPRSWEWSVALLWVLICLLPDAVLLVRGETPLVGDTLTSNLPLKQLAVEQLKEGRIPRWTSKVGCGSPLLADAFSLPFDPRNLWWKVLPPASAYWAMLLTSRLAGGLICLAYFRKRHKLRPLPALVATVVYFCGTLFPGESRLHSHGVILEVFPGLLWLTELLLERASFWRTAALAFGWAAAFFIGSVAYLVYLPVFAAVWAVALWWFGQPRPGFRQLLSFALLYGCSLLWAAGLCGITLVPFVELVGLSNRGGEYPSDPFALRSLLYGLLGAQQSNNYIPEFTFFFYVGVTSLPVILGCCGKRDNAYVRMAPWLALLTLIGLVVLTSPFKPFLVRYVPMLATVAFFRLSFFWGILAAVLVGHGLQSRDYVPSRLAVWSGGILFGLQLAVATSLILMILWLLVLYYESFAVFQEMYDRFGRLFWSSFFVLVVYRALGLGLIWRALSHPRLRPNVCALLILGELVLAWTFVRDREVQGSVYPVTEEVAYLKKNNTSDFRCSEVMLPAEEPANKTLQTDAYASLCLDAPAVHGLLTANLYESLIVREYDRFMAHYGDLDVRKECFPRATNAIMITSVYDSPLLDAQAVRFLLSRSPLPVGPDLRLQVWGRSFLVYERPHALPRAFFVSRARFGTSEEVGAWLEALGVPSGRGEPRANLREEVLLEAEPGRMSSAETGRTRPAVPGRVVADRDSSVQVAVSCPCAGFLVLSDTYCPGWKAFVDGVSVPIYRANGFARAVSVGPGDHVVTFTYRPTSWVWGLRVTATSMVSSLLACAAICLLGHLRRQRPSVAEGQAQRLAA